MYNPAASGSMSAATIRCPNCAMALINEMAAGPPAPVTRMFFVFSMPENSSIFMPKKKRMHGSSMTELPLWWFKLKHDVFNFDSSDLVVWVFKVCFCSPSSHF